MDFEKVEEEQLFKPKTSTDLKAIFSTLGSAGNNPEKLAKILAAYDYAMQLFGWQKDDIASLSHVITQYQASLSAQYHNDFKDVLVAEEVERKRADRKGISILSQ